MTPQQLKAARKRMGLSVLDLARAISDPDGDSAPIARQTICRWESGLPPVPAPLAAAVRLLLEKFLRQRYLADADDGQIEERSLSVMNEVGSERHWLRRQEGCASDGDYDGDYDLARAAGCYVINAASANYSTEREASHDWPFRKQMWKPQNRRSDLVRAAALIVAEIERLDRSIQKEQLYEKEQLYASRRAVAKDKPFPVEVAINFLSLHDGCIVKSETGQQYQLRDVRLYFRDGKGELRKISGQ